MCGSPMQRLQIDTPQQSHVTSPSVQSAQSLAAQYGHASIVRAKMALTVNDAGSSTKSADRVDSACVCLTWREVYLVSPDWTVFDGDFFLDPSTN